MYFIHKIENIIEEDRFYHQNLCFMRTRTSNNQVSQYLIVTALAVEKHHSQQGFQRIQVVEIDDSKCRRDFSVICYPKC